MHSGVLMMRAVQDPLFPGTLAAQAAEAAAAAAYNAAPAAPCAILKDGPPACNMRHYRNIAALRAMSLIFVLQEMRCPAINHFEYPSACAACGDAAATSGT